MDLEQCEIELAKYKQLENKTLTHKSNSFSILIGLVHCVNFEEGNNYHIRFVYTVEGKTGTDTLENILANYNIK